MDGNRRNYYRILHVQADAPAEVIRSSYRTIMQRLRAHPDLGGDNRAATLINEAYAVLTDPARRAAYDASFRPRYQRAAPDGTLPPTPRLPEGLQTGTFVVCAFCREPYTQGRKVLADTLCTGCGSPLYPASRQRDASRGRASCCSRAGPRTRAIPPRPATFRRSACGC
jgi:curved DNA-binding protein CbpA